MEGLRTCPAARGVQAPCPHGGQSKDTASPVPDPQSTCPALSLPAAQSLGPWARLTSAPPPTRDTRVYKGQFYGSSGLGPGNPDVWSNMILGVSVQVFLGEMHMGGGGLSEADGLPQGGWALSNQWKV